MALITVTPCLLPSALEQNLVEESLLTLNEDSSVILLRNGNQICTTYEKVQKMIIEKMISGDLFDSKNLLGAAVDKVLGKIYILTNFVDDLNYRCYVCDIKKEPDVWTKTPILYWFSRLNHSFLGFNIKKETTVNIVVDLEIKNEECIFTSSDEKTRGCALISLMDLKQDTIKKNARKV